MAQSDADATEALPAISKIEFPTRVGPEKELGAVIWFEPGDRALRYRWSEEAGTMYEETYRDGVLHDRLDVGGERELLPEYALVTIAEYISEYRGKPDAIRSDWSHVAELLDA